MYIASYPPLPLQTITIPRHSLQPSPLQINSTTARKPYWRVSTTGLIQMTPQKFVLNTTSIRSARQTPVSSPTFVAISIFITYLSWASACFWSSMTILGRVTTWWFRTWIYSRHIRTKPSLCLLNTIQATQWGFRCFLGTQMWDFRNLVLVQITTIFSCTGTPKSAITASLSHWWFRHTFKAETIVSAICWLP